ncbi:cellulase family glycosylhydrolase [Nonomuraea guangzhouensis]|uniref:Endoglucanase n=1 Tax=Nonomuraea guangzhouensis TaxID=1291555 RepID=A0ABW4G663_9ACTN|nr:cellulase family glycosylhydrolase [Nonomuraea guangzhouensis]
MRSMPWLASVGAALVAVAVSLCTVMFTAIQPAHAAVGLHISGTNIVEANGQKFIMRGVNHPHVWYTNQTSSFANIKALGANTVRVVLGSGKRWGPSTDVANVISLCKQNRLICVLEVHDTTGYGEDGAAATLDEAVNYWISQKSALVGQESYVVINIGNEPIGNTNAAQWTSATTAAIQKMRGNGFEHLLMVDAPNWGQDWQYVMRDNAQTILNADSQHNTVLSIHMYAVFNSAAAITDYLNRFQTNGWPLVIGEFGWRFSASEVDHETLLSEAAARGLGYLGWSWSGNTDPILDMATGFDPNQLTTWGQRIFNGANGIKATAKQATIYGGATPTVTTTITPPPSGSCRVAYVMNTWNTGFTANITITNTGSSATNGWRLVFSLPSGQTITNGWSASYAPTNGQVTATNAGWNGNLAPGGSTTIGFQATHTGNTAAPTSFTLNGAACQVA